MKFLRQIDVPQYKVVFYPKLVFSGYIFDDKPVYIMNLCGFIVLIVCHSF